MRVRRSVQNRKSAGIVKGGLEVSLTIRSAAILMHRT